MDTEHVKRIAEATRKRWANLSKEQREKIRTNQSNGMKAYWSRLTREQRQAIAERIRKTKRERAEWKK